MSKLLRLPLTLLAVLAALLFLPGVASAGGSDTVPTGTCPPDAAAADCTPAGGDTVPGNQTIVPSGNTALGGTPTGPAGSGRAQSAAAAVVPLAALAVPNCDSLPSDVLPPCGPPDCAPLPGDVVPALPLCVPAPPTPPKCVPIPQLGDLCQFPDADCPPVPTAPTAAAVTDGTCTPPITCDRFAQFFGFGDSCSDIPMCIPRDRVPAGFPIPIPSPPLCGPGAGGTPTPPSAPGKGTYMPPPQAAAAPPGVYYANCTDARAQGASNIPQGSPGYRPELDADHDGFACDEAQTTATPTVTTTAHPSGTLAYTGLDLGPQLNVAWTLLVLGAGMLILGRRRT
jgi:hypothetical protein